MDSRSLDFMSAVGASCALRDLTGQDSGLDLTRWEKWAAQHPDLFNKK